MIEILHHYPLNEMNSFGLTVRAAHFARPTDLESLIWLLQDQEYSRMDHLILGEGSNILFSKDYPGLVLQPDMKGIELVEENDGALVVKAGASENWDKLVSYTLERGWYGLENLSLIPGSAGASPIQNIGAYGVELKDRFAWLDAWDFKDSRLVRMNRKDCKFGYRNSIFKREGKGRYMVTQVAFNLSRKNHLKLDYGNVRSEFTKAKGSTPLDLRKVIIEIRRSKLPDPLEYGNAGSFFKNPVVDRTIFNCIRVEFPQIPSYPGTDNQMKIPAAWLIENSGWKGKRMGNVGTWPAQPLVIINYGGATGQEIFDFSEKIMEDVDRIFGIALEREVTVV